MSKPEPFFDVHVKTVGSPNPLVGVCAGYELGEWRAEQLVERFVDWLPEFALRSGELVNVPPHAWPRKLRMAARSIYMTDKYSKRGEFGELLLHMIVREVFDSIPAVSKIYYKDGPNETVKGFDAVHVVANKNDLELWLGEVKFYEKIGIAITHVVNELNLHFQKNYLRTEFAAIVNKLDDSTLHAAKLRELLDPNVSLDQVFSRIRVPVLLTYDSNVVAAYKKTDAAYVAAFTSELTKHAGTFWKATLPSQVSITLILFPLKQKKQLAAAFEKKLKAWQAL